jgi:tetratricopeptide (TPR) repeat protein
MVLGDHLDQALALLHARLSGPAPDRALLAAAAWFEQEVAEDLIDKDQPGKAAPLLREALARPTDDPALLVSALARALLHDHQADQIDPLFERTIAQYPDERTGLEFSWAMLAQNRGQWQRSEDLLQAVLRREPDNDEADNALGYTWADQDRNLDQARQMIEHAVEVRPGVAAYEDSLGWVLYKLGRFQAAQEHLALAAGLRGGAEPTILNHLGDAQYRLGRHDDALRLWRDAKDMLPDHRHDDDAETASLGPLLDRKIEAASAAKPAPVARAPGADGPATAPATAPTATQPLPPQP